MAREFLVQWILGEIPFASDIVLWFQVIGSGDRDAQLLMLLTLTKSLTGLGYGLTVSFFFTLLVIYVCSSCTYSN